MLLKSPQPVSIAFAFIMFLAAVLTLVTFSATSGSKLNALGIVSSNISLSLVL